MRARRADAFADLYKRIFLSADEFEFPAFCRRTEINFQRTPKNVQLSPKPLCGRRAKMPGVKNVKNSESFFVGVFSPPFIWVSLFRVFDIVVFPSFFSAAREMSPRERVDRALTFFNLSSRVLFKEKKKGRRYAYSVIKKNRERVAGAR